MIAAVLNRMIAYNGTDTRRVAHALKVFAFAHALSGDMEPRARRTLLLAAILHDIGIHNAERKYQSSAGPYQELEGPPVAREILAAEGVPPETVERACFLIGHHHSYAAVDGEDFQILIEADFLVNIDEDRLPVDAIRTIRDRYFRTAAGRAALTALYGTLSAE